MKQYKESIFLVIGLFGVFFFQSIPSYEKVKDTPNARDFSSFYYAQKNVFRGSTPYSSKELGALARSENTRTYVHPYFYPPPAVYLFTWAQGLSLHSAYLWFWGINQIATLGLLVLLKRWIGMSWLPIGLLFALCFPIQDCMMMGQVNIIVLLLMVWGLYKNQGGVFAAAAMIKMSPALLLLPQIIWKKWRFIGYAIAFAIISSLLTLPIMNIFDQISFYTIVLPQFSSGQYSGLTVPINIDSNHSIPELCGQLFPSKNTKELSDTARICAPMINVGILSILSWLAWKNPNSKHVLGAFIVLMVLTPIYTYEHHLVFLLVPAAILLHSCKERAWFFTICAYMTLFFLFWPLSWWREAQTSLPQVAWGIQESKTFSALSMMVLLCYCTLRPVLNESEPVLLETEKRVQ